MPFSSRTSLRIGLPLLFAMSGCGGQGAGGGAPTPAACQLAHITSLPLATVEDAYVTTIGLNGQPARMMFDTGADRSLISSAARQRLKLGGDTFNSETLGGIKGYAGASIAAVDDVQLGSVHGKRLALRSTSDWNPPKGVDGLLGMDYLAAFDLDIDLISNQVGLYRALEGCHDPRTAMTGALYGVDMISHYDDEGFESPVVSVTMNGHTFEAIMDTGNFHTSIYGRAVDRAGLAGLESFANGTVSGIGREKAAAKVIMAPQLQIGDLTIKNFPMVVVDTDTAEAPSILLGRDFFERVHVWISHSSNSVIMQYPPAATPGG